MPSRQAAEQRERQDAEDQRRQELGASEGRSGCPVRHHSWIARTVTRLVVLMVFAQRYSDYLREGSVSAWTTPSLPRYLRSQNVDMPEDTC